MLWPLKGLVAGFESLFMLVYHSDHGILPHSSNTSLHGTMRSQRSARHTSERRPAAAARTIGPFSVPGEVPCLFWSVHRARSSAATSGRRRSLRLCLV